MGSMVGTVVMRKEDPALLTGRGTFVDDVQLSGTVHMAYVRSYLAHARIVSIDTTGAAAMPGVLGVWTHDDLPGLPPSGAPRGAGGARRLAPRRPAGAAAEPVGAGHGAAVPGHREGPVRRGVRGRRRGHRQVRRRGRGRRRRGRVPGAAGRGDRGGGDGRGR